MAHPNRAAIEVVRAIAQAEMAGARLHITCQGRTRWS
jgi:hypothetical protein